MMVAETGVRINGIASLDKSWDASMTPRVVNLIGHAHCIIPGIRQAGKVAATASQVIASPSREGWC
jgi:hypothetical protein